MRCLAVCLALLGALTLPASSWALFGAAAERPRVGGDAPRFTAPLLDGGDFDLGPLIGQKAILLDFWSIYCVSCVQEMPKLAEISNRWGSQLAVVGIDLDSFGTKRVAQFVKGLAFKVPYPIVIDKSRQVAARYGVSVLPTTIVIDRQGRIHYYHVGYAPGDEKEIEEKVTSAVGAK
ncbi:MAG: TlpA family protein disulfide reductase [Deltaproteobacteria bacterium]|nr:TlpA family protein disulfide reductase [Deltaproteobacteria bacterium]